MDSQTKLLFNISVAFLLAFVFVSAFNLTDDGRKNNQTDQAALQEVSRLSNSANPSAK